MICSASSVPGYGQPVFIGRDLSAAVFRIGQVILAVDVEVLGTGREHVDGLQALLVRALNFRRGAGQVKRHDGRDAIELSDFVKAVDG